MNTDLTVVILTYNEEANLSQALDSVIGWGKDVFIVDSFSTDRTLEIAHTRGCGIYQFPFENYARQRNRALAELPITTGWTLFLDADEWIPNALKQEISGVIAGNPQETGFYLRRKFLWMNTWIRRGYYPTWILRLFRTGRGRCEDRSVNEHILVDGPIGYLDEDFIHEDRKPVADWIEKHNRYAIKEAKELIRNRAKSDLTQARFWGSQSERVRWLRERVYNECPVMIRPLLLLFYRLILKGGILDGRWALVYHFLQAFWYPLLIDINFLESKSGRLDRETASPGDSLQEDVLQPAK